jgi:hypothetical protein
MNPLSVLRPDRVRAIERPFGWAPCRLVMVGWLARLSLPAKALYLGLCLVADRRGLSCWSERRLGAALGMDAAALRAAQGELARHDLLAFDGQCYQLLSLPAAGAPARPTTPHVAPEPAVSPRRPASEAPFTPASPEHIAAIIAPLMAKLERP